MLGHDDVPRQRESVAVAHLAQDLHEEILGANGSEQRQAPVAATRDEVEIVLTVAASQSFRHGKLKPRPPPLKGVKDGAPKLQPPES